MCVIKSAIETEMLWWIVTASLGVFLVYVVRVLFFGLDEEEKTSLSDFLKEEEGEILVAFQLTFLGCRAQIS